MDFKAGTAEVFADAERGFDPDEAAEFLVDSGFTIPKLRVTARGELERRDGRWLLRIAGLDAAVPLAGGAQAEVLNADGREGRSARIVGMWSPGQGDRPPTMTVEEFGFPNP